MTAAFPHRVAPADAVSPAVFGDQVLFSPFGNDVTLEAAREIIRYEELGRDEYPDILCINFSSNDYVGHAFGPDSLEVEDMTYQTDRQLAEFLSYLDEQVGAGKWTVALTADHGVAPIVEFAVQSRLPARRNPLGSPAEIRAQLESLLRGQLPDMGGPMVEHVEHGQVYLKRGHPALSAGNFELAQRLVRDWLLDQPHVAAVRIRSELAQDEKEALGAALHRAWHPRRSGDVLYVYGPYCVPGTRGTTHGSPWHYDTHVPLMLIGAGITPGRHDRPVSPACLASSISNLLGIDYPSANAESPLYEALQER
jgi:hypothetical protein